MSQIDKDAIIPTNDEENIYACRACYSAIDFNGYKHYRKACEYTDGEIAKLKNYVDASIASVYNDMNALQRNLQGQINDLYSAHNQLVRDLNRR